MHKSSNANLMRGAGSSASSSSSPTSASASSSIATNNYYGFGDRSSNNNISDNDISNGGGLSYVIHPATANTASQQQNNLPSISSVASTSSSASSSGISSGSSTITKSAAFNGNTFTRSKPKERKSLPSAWQQQQEAQDQPDSSPQRNHHHHHQNSSKVASAADSGPFLVKGKGVIPSVTLSEATPSPATKKNKGQAAASPGNTGATGDLYYFDTSNSSSGGGSVILTGRKSTSTTFSSGGDGTQGGEGSEDGDTSALHDQSIFEPGACSTFILPEGQEFPNDDSSNSRSRSASHFNSKSNGESSSNSVSSGNSAIINKNGGRELNGIRKMKADVDKRGSGGQLKDGSSSSSSGGSSSEQSPTNNCSSGSIVANNGSQFLIGGGEEENFECFGDGSESFTFQESSTTSGSGEASLQYTRDGTDLELSSSGAGGATTPLSRNSWTRTSLRKSPQNSNSSPSDAMGYRRWGSFRNPSGTKRTPPVVTSSNALANQLYRSSSFHSSGRSSAGDAEEMYSDGSLEDEVLDLTHKVHHLEEKMNVLAENQNDADDRYTREKEKNAELSTKVFMLEEQLRETELRGDEKMKEEQRRFKEFQSRWDREKQLQSENYEIKLQSMEKDLNSAKSEAHRFKSQLERERGDKENLSEKLYELERELGQTRDENRLLQEQARRDREQMTVETQGAQQTLMELKREMESMRQFQMQNSPSSLRSLRNGGGVGEDGMSLEEELMQGQELKGRVKEYEEEIKRLKRMNQQLQESNDELNAQLLNRGLEEGRTLLTTINSVPAGNSLAAEFEAMSQDQTALGLYADSETDLAKVKKALKEQIEVNEQLRAYIDGILLIIVENNPQLLEVKNNHSSSNGHASSSCSSSPNSKTSIANPNCAVAPPAEQKQSTSSSSNSKVNFANGLAKISFSRSK